MTSLRELALVALGPLPPDVDATQLPQELIDAHHDAWKRFTSCRACWLHNRNIHCPDDMICVSASSEADRWATLFAATGGVECLECAHRNGHPWNPHTTSVAASNGHLDCLIYAHLNGCPWDDPYTTNAAAAYGHLDCLEYAHRNGCCLLYTSPSPRDLSTSRMPSSA